jgi:hypothetical protein
MGIIFNRLSWIRDWVCINYLRLDIYLHFRTPKNPSRFRLWKPSRRRRFIQSEYQYCWNLIVFWLERRHHVSTWRFQSRLVVYFSSNEWNWVSQIWFLKIKSFSVMCHGTSWPDLSLWNAKSKLNFWLNLLPTFLAGMLGRFREVWPKSWSRRMVSLEALFLSAKEIPVSVNICWFHVLLRCNNVHKFLE